MNIFVLDNDPYIAAKLHCNKHVVKMIVESAQLLSTAHRLLDGENYIEVVNGRRLQRWKLPDDCRENLLYKATHWNHPCAAWVRQCNGNYFWALSHLQALLKEYSRRYHKFHKCDTLRAVLWNAPTNLPSGTKQDFAVCINEDIYPGVKTDDPIESYRRYYKAKRGQAKFKMEWPRGEQPSFV